MSLFLNEQKTTRLMRQRKVLVLPLICVKHYTWNGCLIGCPLMVQMFSSCGWNNNLILKFLETYRSFWWTDVPCCLAYLWGIFSPSVSRDMILCWFISILGFLISLTSSVSAFRTSLSFLQGPISLCSVSHFLCLTRILPPL